VLLVDVDHFKQVNDRYGHEAGDAVLQPVAAVPLTAPVRHRTTWIGALGRREFSVLAPYTDADGAKVLASAARGGSLHAGHTQAGEVSPSRSAIGAANATAPGTEIDAVQRAADDEL
jgi:diguanylate cyclase (GGDEF)-like protein